MTCDGSRAHDRYQAGADRDDAADERDTASRARDEVAERREAAADARDDERRQADEDFDDLLSRVRRQLIDRLARIENHTVDPDDWPGITAAALARLQAEAAEQRRLAHIDRVAVRYMIDELRDMAQLLPEERRAAARDRFAAARDRDDAADDRQSSASDREFGARDRGDSVIEQEQQEPDGYQVPELEPMIDRGARAVDSSKEHIATSRALLGLDGRAGTDTGPPDG